MRGGTPENALRGIQARNPGLHSFAVPGSSDGWRIDINALNFGQGCIVAVKSSSFSLSFQDDELVRLYVPLDQFVDFRTRSEHHKLGPGSAVILPEGEFSCDFSNGFRCLIGTFPRQIVFEALKCLGGVSGQQDRFQPLFQNGHALELVRRQLLSMVRCIDDSSEAMINAPRFQRAQEELLLLHLAQALAVPVKGEGERGASSPHVRRATEFIRSKLHDEIGPMAVAAAAGCSLRNLQLLFRKEYGRTITAFVRELRLRSARERLLASHGEDPVTLVALESGFSHLSDFARHYREAFGESPSQTAHDARAGRLKPARPERA